MRNCENCTHLVWDGGDDEDTFGYTCTKRDYFKHGDPWKNEKRHQDKLDDETYRKRAKKCAEIKP